MGKEKNGIIGLEDIFNISPAEEVYSREDDIIPVSNKPVVDEVPVGKVNLEEIEKESKKPEEEKVEEKPAPDKEEPKVEDIIPKINYLSVITEFNKRGVLPNLEDVVFGAEDGSEVTINDLDLTDEDVFYNVITTVLEGQKEDLQKDKIDVGQVSDFTKKLIQADKAGANIIDILKQYDQTAAPIERLDIDNKADQIKIIRHYVDLLGLPKDEADEFYKGIINKGEEYVEAKAIKYKSELDKKMDSIIQERTRQAAEKKAKDLEDFKRYKKELKNSFQQKYQLNDNMVAKALDFSLKSIEGKPGVSKAHERVREMLMNPEEAPDLIMFLMNPEEFVKQKSNKVVTEEKKRIYKMVSHASKDKKVSPVDDKGNPRVGMTFDEIELNN